MSAVERLAAALSGSTHYDGIAARFDGRAQNALAADPHLAQDLEDGAALRRLKEALPDGWDIAIDVRGNGWVIRLYDRENKAQVREYGDTIAAAADACREAIEAKR